jgi:hypothetical protein
LVTANRGNVDLDVAEGFGHERSSFPQRENEMNQVERKDIFQGYFGIFPRTRYLPVSSLTPEEAE